MSLKWIIPGMVIGFSLIPTLLAIILSSQVLVSNLNQRVSSHMAAVAEQQALGLTVLLKQQESLISSLAKDNITLQNFRAFNSAWHNQDFQSTVQGTEQGTEQGIGQNRDIENSRLSATLRVIGEAQYRHLTQYIGTLDLESIWVLNNEGLIYQTTSQKQSVIKLAVMERAQTLFKDKEQNSEQDRSQESKRFSVWLEKMITSPPEQPRIRLMQVGNDWRIAAFVPVHSQGLLQGSLLAFFKLESIKEIIEHWHGKGKTGRSYLAIDELGVIYFQDNQIQAKFMDHSYIDQNYQENTQPIYTNFDGQAVFGSQREVDFHQHRWRIFSEITVAEINRENRTLIRQLLLMGAGVAILALGVGFLLSRRIVHSLEQLSTSVRGLSIGNYSIEIPRGGPSEIDTLSQVMDKLRVQLLSKIGALKVANIQLDHLNNDLEKQLEQLRLSSEIIANIHEGVGLIRAEDGVLLFTNSAFEKMFGYAPNELPGKHVSILNAPTAKSPQETAAEIIAELNTVGQWEGEIHNIKKNGTPFWNYVKVSLFEHPEYGPVWITVQTDITELKQAEEARAKSESKYRELVDNSLLGVFTTDMTNQFIFVNDAMVQMYDFDSVEQMEATTTLSLWADIKDREPMLEALKKYGRVDNFEAETITHTGRRIYVIFSAGLNDGHISGMVMDITKRKISEQKIQRYQQRLKSLTVQLTLAEEWERRRIAADLHDNIGQSLVFSRIQLSSLRSQASNEKFKELIDELSQSLLHIIQDTKELLFELSSPLLYELGLSAAISHWLSEQISRKHGLETEFIDHSPNRLQDKEMSMILFRNIRELLINVVKHAHAKKVIVSFENCADNLIITVQDDGIGFIFDPGNKTLQPEVGFGLFSIQERMDDVGGSLKIESGTGQGCKAILTAPLNV
jgi:PAS domain S-box-containing protein